MRWTVLFSLFLPAVANAAGLIPGPNEPGWNSALGTKAARFDRQFHTFNASPFGLSLDAEIPDPDDRTAMIAFLSQDAVTDFLAFTTAQGRPRTPEQVVAERGEHGDLGMFAGVPAAGEAYRYAVLRDRGGSAAEIAAARQDLIDAIEAFHVYANITGTVGPIARGIRLASEAGPPPEPQPVSCPNAWQRRDAWRNDQSARFGNYLFLDNTSKDQMLGYVMAIGAFWDAIAEDATIPQQLKDNLRADALGLGQMLMQPVAVGQGLTVDLAIRDTNNCLTRFHDLNPREIIRDNAEPIVLSEQSTTQNGFNALAALGIMRTLYHISGDNSLRTYYYDELVARRNYPALVTSGPARVRNMYLNFCAGGTCAVTNFSNVNMAFTAIYGLLRYETDPTLLATYRSILETELWDAMRPHDGIEIEQAFFNMIYAGLKSGPSDMTAASNAAAQLLGFRDPPYFNVEVINCDPGEIAAGSCVAVDGVTMLTIDDVPARGGGVAAVSPLPIQIRPPSNFEWRSDPRVVNGGGGNRLNPGGDFRAAYWIGRYLIASSDNSANLSPIGRNRDGSGGPVFPSPDAGVIDTGVVTDGGVAADGGVPDSGFAPDGAAVDGGFIADAVVAPDAGEDPDSGSASADASAIQDAGISGADAGTEPTIPDESGCSCAVRESRSSSSWWLGVVLSVLLIARDRRRRGA